MLTEEAITRAADALARARDTRSPIDGLPEGCRPSTLDEVYAIQQGVFQRRGLPVVGYKVGAASREIMEADNLPSPVWGRLYAPFVHSSPARLPREAFLTLRNCETEFTFRMGTDLPPRPEPYSREDVVTAVASVHPSIEVGDSAYQDRKAVKPYLGVPCDNAGAGRHVYAEGVSDWRSLDLPGFPVTLHVNGTLRTRGTGAAVLGDPVVSVLWLANELSARGIGLRRGDLIASGSMTGFNYVEPGDEAVADFGPLGECRIQFLA